MQPQVKGLIKTSIQASREVESNILDAKKSSDAAEKNLNGDFKRISRRRTIDPTSTICLGEEKTTFSIANKPVMGCCEASPEKKPKAPLCKADSCESDPNSVTESHQKEKKDRMVDSFWKTQERDSQYNNFHDFSWQRHRMEVLVSCCSVVGLLMVFAIIQMKENGWAPVLMLPWFVTSCLSTILLRWLFGNYDRNRIKCKIMASLVYLTASCSWFLPRFLCLGRPNLVGLLHMTGKQGVHSFDFIFVVTLLLLSCYVPVIGWKESCILGGALACLVLSSCPKPGFQVVYHENQVAHAYLIFIIMILGIVLSYIASSTERELFVSLSIWKETLVCSYASRKQALQELEETKQQNSEKVAKMRQYISYIFHEIRVPFNAVVLGIGHLLAVTTSEEQQDVLKMMEASSSSMIRILNDVLDMGKIEAGKLQLEKRPFNMVDLINSLIWAYKDTLESKGLEFSLCVDQSTKALLSSHNLLGDKHRVRQVLANYLSNAAKFTPRGGKVKLHMVCNATFVADTLKQDMKSVLSRDFTEESGTMQIEHDFAGAGKKKNTFASITVSVEDTGIGISKEDQSRLFEPYMQIKAGCLQGGGGTGLGLSFAKRIVELAGGSIGVFSEVGKGSVFFFTLPFEISPVPSERKEVDIDLFKPPTNNQFGSSAFGIDSPRGRNPRVLIVEDNQVNRRILKKLLSSLNVETEDAENGKQAVELCRDGATFDMILIDKEMPIMDGHEATRELRAMGIMTPIVGLTGNALDSDRNQFLAAGVNDFFTKPLSRPQLVKLLEAHRLISHSEESFQSSSNSAHSYSD